MRARNDLGAALARTSDSIHVKIAVCRGSSGDSCSCHASIIRQDSPRAIGRVSGTRLVQGISKVVGRSLRCGLPIRSEAMLVQTLQAGDEPCVIRGTLLGGCAVLVDIHRFRWKVACRQDCVQYRPIDGWIRTYTKLMICICVRNTSIALHKIKELGVYSRRRRCWGCSVTRANQSDARGKVCSTAQMRSV